MSQFTKRNLFRAGSGMILGLLVFSLLPLISAPIVSAFDTPKSGGYARWDEIQECKKEADNGYRKCMKEAREHRNRCTNNPDYNYQECRTLYKQLTSGCRHERRQKKADCDDIGCYPPECNPC